MDEPAGGEIDFNLGRQQRSVAYAERRDQAGAPWRRAHLRAPPRESGPQLGDELPWSRARCEQLERFRRALVGDSTQRQIAPPVALAGIERSRRIAEPRVQADARSAAERGCSFHQDDRDRMRGRVVSDFARSRLEPVDAYGDRQSARAGLGFEHESFDQQGLAAAAIERWIDESAVERRVARHSPHASAPQQSEGSADRPDRRAPPPQRADHADGSRAAR